MRFLAIVFCCLVCTTHTWSQQKYWIFFSDKGNIQDNDLNGSVYQPYIDQMESQGCVILSQSKWLNAIAVRAPESAKFKNYDFVKMVKEVGRPLVELADSHRLTDYDLMELTLRQMDGETFLKKGLTGKNIKIGVIDAGYSKVKTISALEHLIDSKLIKNYKNFVDTTVQDYDIITSGSTHGQKVLRKIAGYESEDKRFIGFARNSQFYLTTTENSKSETQIEEYDWVRALEWMDSLGVKLVNSSLGYSQFDDQSENYLTTEMDGQHGITSKAAEIAARERGMLLVISAGNAGAKPWRLVTVPADAPSVLTVGATQLKGPIKIAYSSVGPDYTDFLKPDVSAYSPNGTSFSAPVVTGFMACLMEYAPELSNFELMEVIKKSSGIYPFGNNFIGYGIPSATEAIKIIDEYRITDSLKSQNQFRKILARKKKVKLTISNFPTKDLSIFHKKNNWIVLDQFLLSPYAKLEFLKQKKVRLRRSKKKFTMILKQSKAVNRSTIQSGNEIVEIIWEQK